MNEYNLKCDRCGDVRTMFAKDSTVTISHAKCGTYRNALEVNIESKTSESKTIASKPPKSLPIESISVDPKNEIDEKYFHPKIKLVEKYRCPTCFEIKKCPQKFQEKIYCFIDFKFKTIQFSNTNFENIEGILSRDPSRFETIELEDINQKFNSYDYVRLIINRDDRYSQQKINIDDPTKDNFPDINETLTYEILIKSFKGEITIGTRPINPFNNSIKWICYDVDKKHNESPRGVVDALVNYLKQWYGLTGYVELSGSIDSYHIWLFLQPVDNNIAYNFDQDFRARLKSTGIGIDNKSIERGVQLKDGGMIKLPYNFQRKEKYGHKGGRSRFIEGVDLSKIIPEKLPEPWGNSQSSELDTFVYMTKKPDTEINTTQPMPVEKIDQINNIMNEIIKNNEKVDGLIKCNKCNNDKFVVQNNIKEVVDRLKTPHSNCGGKISFGLTIFETSIEILKLNTESVRNFCDRFVNNPNKKTEFDFEIRPTSNDKFENTLILKTKTQTNGKELAGWIVNSAALKGKLHQPAPEPFKQVKVFDFSINFENYIP